MKRKICMALCLALIFANVPSPVKAYGYFLETIGEAIPGGDGFLLVSGIGLTEDSWDEVLLRVEGAEVFDLRTGFALSPQDITEGDTLRVVYEPIQSDYPMARALTIYVHAGEADTADFMVVVSDNIWYSNEGCAFVTVDGKYRITLTDDSLLMDKNGYEMSYDEIVPGMEMFVWATFVTASFPGQVIPDKIVLLR